MPPHCVNRVAPDRLPVPPPMKRKPSVAARGPPPAVREQALAVHRQLPRLREPLPVERVQVLALREQLPARRGPRSALRVRQPMLRQQWPALREQLFMERVTHDLLHGTRGGVQEWDTPRRRHHGWSARPRSKPFGRNRFPFRLLSQTESVLFLDTIPISGSERWQLLFLAIIAAPKSF
jgi:hypothetical protein